METEADTLAFLLGKNVLALELQQLEGLWLSIASNASYIYQRNIMLKEGIG